MNPWAHARQTWTGFTLVHLDCRPTQSDLLIFSLLQVKLAQSPNFSVCYSILMRTILTHFVFPVNMVYLPKSFQKKVNVVNKVEVNKYILN